MENTRHAAGDAADQQAIMEMLEQLPPEYVRKVKIFANTLLKIFVSRSGCGRVS